VLHRECVFVIFPPGERPTQHFVDADPFEKGEATHRRIQPRRDAVRLI